MFDWTLQLDITKLRMTEVGIDTSRRPATIRRVKLSDDLQRFQPGGAMGGFAAGVTNRRAGGRAPRLTSSGEVVGSCTSGLRPTSDFRVMFPARTCKLGCELTLSCGRRCNLLGGRGHRPAAFRYVLDSEHDLLS